MFGHGVTPYISNTARRKSLAGCKSLSANNGAITRLNLLTMEEKARDDDSNP
jgi:hypothetical protein